jgi:hypothetical protein
MSLSREAIKAGLLIIVNWLASLADSTELTKVDDEAVDVARAIVEEEVLFDWFFARGEAAADGTLSLESPTPEILAVMERRKIDFAKLLEIATTLWTLYRTFSGK